MTAKIVRLERVKMSALNVPSIELQICNSFFIVSSRVSPNACHASRLPKTTKSELLKQNVKLLILIAQFKKKWSVMLP